MRQVLIFGFLSFIVFGCQKYVDNKVSRIPLEESETFYLSQVPRRIQVLNKSLFVHERYHQAVGVYSLENGKILDLFELDSIDFKDLYNSVSSTDSLVWEYDSIADLSYFINGNRIENFLVEGDTLYLIISLSVPYHDKDTSKMAYRHWHPYNYLIAFDMTLREYSWRRLDTEGYDITKVAVGNLSNFSLVGNYLVSPMNMVNDSSTKVMVLKKEGEFLYKFQRFISLTNETSIELAKGFYYSEIINNQEFIQINSTTQKCYNVLVDENNNLKLKPYKILDEVVLDRYFPAKLGVYSCINSVGDTILSLDWSANSVPFVKNDTREIYYINYENEKYNLHIVPF